MSFLADLLHVVIERHDRREASDTTQDGHPLIAFVGAAGETAGLPRHP